MPTPLIAEDKQIRFGHYNRPVHINFQDWPQRTPMGYHLPGFFRKWRFKQFLFIGITDGKITAGTAIADLGYAVKAFFYLKHPAAPNLMEESRLSLPTQPPVMDGSREFPVATFTDQHLSIRIQETGISVITPTIRMDARFRKETPFPLRLCTRTGYTGWTFTRKAAPIPVSGNLLVAGTTYSLDPESCRAITDRTCGFLRRETFWNWAASAAVLPDGREFGMNLAWGVNETGFTENRIWVDGVATDLPGVVFTIPENRKTGTWRVHTPDLRLDLFFSPTAAKTEKTQMLFAATDFVQNMGRFSGVVTTGAGETIPIDSIPGWTEDHYVKW